MSNLINIGSLNISKCYLGASDTRLYLGDTLVYPIEQPTYNYLYKAEKYNDTDYEYACGTATTVSSTIARSAATASQITGETIQQGSPTAMIFGDCCTAIGNSACSGWTHLSALTFSDSVQTIGNSAFTKDKQIMSVAFGSGLTSIGEWAFYQNVLTGDSSVFDVDLTRATSLSSIGDWAFNASGVRRLRLPNSNLTIGREAFKNSKRLVSVEFGSGNTIGLSGFTYCSSLTSVTFNNQTDIPAEAFDSCFSLSSITIPDSVRTIGTEAFNSCSGLTQITIGSGITSIAASAFTHLLQLQEITVLATTPPSIGVGALDDTNSAIIYVPSQSVSTYKAATGWNTYSSRIQAIV